MGRSGKKYSEEKAAAMFYLTDINKDGFVDFAEFLVMQVRDGHTWRGGKRGFQYERHGTACSTQPPPRRHPTSSSPRPPHPPQVQKQQRASLKAAVGRSSSHGSLQPRATPLTSGGSRGASPSHSRLAAESSGEYTDLAPYILREYLKAHPQGDGRVRVESHANVHSRTAACVCMCTGRVLVLRWGRSPLHTLTRR